MFTSDLSQVHFNVCSHAAKYQQVAHPSVLLSSTCTLLMFLYFYILCNIYNLQLYSNCVSLSCRLTDSMHVAGSTDTFGEKAESSDYRRKTTR